MNGFPVYNHFFDYLGALERLATLTGQKRIAGNDWYAEGAAALLPYQRKDGRVLPNSSTNGRGSRATSLSIQVLSRASRDLGR